MSRKRIGLMLSVGRLWAMSRPFRLGCRSPEHGFSPGIRGFWRYEVRRFWHRIYERERLEYHFAGLRKLMKRMGLGQ